MEKNNKKEKENPVELQTSTKTNEIIINEQNKNKEESQETINTIVIPSEKIK